MKKTPYRRSQRNRALEELTAEVRALRAEVAMLRASQVQIVPYPYPQPYPVYPVMPPRPYYPTWTTITTANEFTLTNATAPGAAGGWDGSTNVVLGSAVGD